MKTKIYFIERSTSFNCLDLNSPNIAGSEKTLINISNELSKKENLYIKVFNNTKNEYKNNNLQWLNINKINPNDKPDFLIAMSDCNLLSLINCKKKYLWSHSVQSIEKFIRNKQFLSFLKNKPIMLLESSYHFKTRNFFTSFFGKKIIPIAPDNDFIDTKINKSLVPSKKAIFNTRPDRNLQFLLECWRDISKLVDDCSLYINPPFKLTNEHKEIGIKLRVKGDKNDLINDLINSRLMLNPGHKGEVFCLAAEETRELCLPIVTMGYGALSERVEHGLTGYIAKSKKEFIRYSADILNNDELYLKLKSNLISKKGYRTYANVVDDFLNILHEN